MRFLILFLVLATAAEAKDCSARLTDELVCPMGRCLTSSNARVELVKSLEAFKPEQKFELFPDKFRTAEKVVVLNDYEDFVHLFEHLKSAVPQAWKDHPPAPISSHGILPGGILMAIAGAVTAGASYALDSSSGQVVGLLAGVFGAGVAGHYAFYRWNENFLLRPSGIADEAYHHGLIWQGQSPYRLTIWKFNQGPDFRVPFRLEVLTHRHPRTQRTMTVVSTYGAH